MTVVVIAVVVHLGTAMMGLAAAYRHTTFGYGHHLMFLVCWVSWLVVIVGHATLVAALPGPLLCLIPFVSARRRLHRVIGVALVLSWLPLLVTELSRSCGDASR